MTLSAFERTVFAIFLFTIPFQTRFFIGELGTGPASGEWTGVWLWASDFVFALLLLCWLSRGAKAKDFTPFLVLLAAVPALLLHGNALSIWAFLKVIEGIRPGVISFSLGHGHWAYGGRDVVVDGRTVKGDPRQTTGVHLNAAMRVDPYLKNTCLVDPVGASAVFYDTRVKVAKA